MRPLERFRIRKNEATHRLSYVPIVTLMAHSRCNCRCTMCDIWKNNRHVEELQASDLERLLADFKTLNTRRFIFSGGEALMHSDLWSLCRALEVLQPRLTLLTTGLLLERHSEACADTFADVIVSLDGPEAVHNKIRNIPNGYHKLAQGVAALRRANVKLPVHARCVIQRGNFAALPDIVDAALELGLNGISFLPADISSEAFNHPGGWIASDVERVGLAENDLLPFADTVEQLIAHRRALFDNGFIAESPEKLRRMVDYFRAHLGQGAFPTVSCNAPWVSLVIETNGDLRPCFFHRTLGNIRQTGLIDILNGDAAVTFRRELDVASNDICRKCTCTLKISQSG